MSLIDPYQIATMGQNSRNTFTLASNGILVDVFIDIIIPPVEIPSSGIIPGQESPPKGESDRCKKRITVVTTINGKEYTESIEVETCIELSAKNVEVDINQNSEIPTINISVILPKK